MIESMSYLEFAPLNPVFVESIWNSSNLYDWALLVKNLVYVPDVRVKFILGEQRANIRKLKDNYDAYEKFFLSLIARDEIIIYPTRNSIDDYAEPITYSSHASTQALLSILELTNSPTLILRVAGHSNLPITAAASTLLKRFVFYELNLNTLSADYTAPIERKCDEYLKLLDWEEDTLNNISLVSKLKVIA